MPGGRLSLGVGICLAIYLAGLVAIVFGLSRIRESTIDELSAPESKAQWQKWKSDAARQDGTKGTVARRAPKSDDPPMLVLLRDSYPAILVATLTIYSFLFGLAVFIGRGMLRGSRTDG